MAEFHCAVTLHVRDCAPAQRDQLVQIVGAVVGTVLEMELVALPNKDGDVHLGYLA